MSKWEIAVYQSQTIGPIGLEPGAWALSETTRDTGGKSDLDAMNEMAAEGWELVAVTPLIDDAKTRSLLFTFKRAVSA